MAVKAYLNNARKISLFLVALTFSAIVHAKIIYVDDDGPADFTKIQAAINDANDGDIIIVNPGTYTGYGNRDIDFKGKAITVQSTDPNDPNIVDSTIIDCDQLGRGFFFHSGEDGNSILSGFTVMNGQAPIGGGIYCENQSGPTIANCVIKWNTADGRESGSFGGGISGCKGTIINCTISGNTAGGTFYGSGGGLYDCNGPIINCIVSLNILPSGGKGGGISECNGDIINCKILNNYCSWGWLGHGGGLYRCNGRIFNSTISGNDVAAEGQAYGGGLYACNGPIINCTISGNEAHSEYLDAYGGGLDKCNGKIINCAIRQNTASGGSGDDESTSGYGGGLYGCNGTISNCTISDNRAEGGWAWGGEYNWGCGGGLGGCDGNIINCTISYNMATVLGGSYYSGGAGGGLYGCDGRITNCKIIGNTAADVGWYAQHAFGGGTRGCDGTIANYTVIRDTASEAGWYEQRAFGGGLFACDATISNCTISGNIARSDYDCFGGGLYGCDGMIINCTISGNTAMLEDELAVGDATGGGLYRCNGTIINCIIWANSAKTGSQVYSSSEPNYSCLQDHIGSGTGNIGDDPLFTDPGYWDTTGVWIDGDYHLLHDSSCIDTGDPNYIAGPNETDLDGRPRVIGGRIDMGAYEHQPRVIYVDDDAPNDPGPGDPTISDLLEDGTEEHPFDAIQEAIDATRCGDTVIVLDGTYTGAGNRDIAFKGKAITVHSENGPESCIIDCQDSGRGFCFHYSEDANCVLSAFTITNGNSSKGGAVYCSHYSCPTLTDCIIVGNTATSNGGATWGGSPTFIDCIFSNNSAGFNGGAIYNFDNPTLINCAFIENSAKNGGGMYSSNGSPTLINCMFIGNSATATYSESGGGGMFNGDMDTVTLIDCTFIGNFALILGGGMLNYECSSPTIINCMFSGNTVYYGDGGGICNRDNSSPTLINCTLNGNLAGSNCGGIYNKDSSNPKLTNCILWSNIDSGGMDESAQIHTKYGMPIVNYSCIQGWSGSLGGTGNIGDDPLFVDADGPDNTAGTEDDNLRLSTGSSCIDTGDPNYIAGPNETDLDGRPRVIGGRIDMGAYEAPIMAEARIVPQTINLASKGSWLTCYIWLPEQYNIADIEPNSILLEDEVKPEQFLINEDQQFAIAKFSRSEVQAILEAGDINLTITVRLTDGTVFEATDKIKVINKAANK